jgi:hypothetical protein
MLRVFFSTLHTFRTVSVLLAIVAMLCVSAASVSAAHTHLKDPVDSCDVCCTAHMAARQVAEIQVIHAPQIQSILPPPAAIQAVESRGVLSKLTRGPPYSR